MRCSPAFTYRLCENMWLEKSCQIYLQPQSCPARRTFPTPSPGSITPIRHQRSEPISAGSLSIPSSWAFGRLVIFPYMDGGRVSYAFSECGFIMMAFPPTIGCSVSGFCRLLAMKTAPAHPIKRPAIKTPMDIPATAPPETPEFCEGGSSVEDSCGAGVKVTTVVEIETVGVAVAVIGVPEVGDPVVDILVTTDPSVDARLIALSVPQQLEVLPQHQVSVPGHLAISILPLSSVSELCVVLVDRSRERIIIEAFNVYQALIQTRSFPPILYRTALSPEVGHIYPIIIDCVPLA